MTTGPKSQCGACRHFLSFLDPPIEGRPVPSCSAFTQGVPMQIYANGLDHRQPIDGDGGVRWESDGDPFPEWAFQPASIGQGGALYQPVTIFGRRE